MKLEYALLRTTVQRRSMVTGRTVTTTLDVRRTCAEISAQDYVAFRDFARDLASRLRDEISFAGAGPHR